MLQHFLFTRYSVRVGENRQGMFGVAADSLLTPERLQMRFDLFRAIALPSVVAQDEVEFTWCIAVDPEMPPAFKEDLERVLAPYPNFHLVALPFGQGLETLDWVMEFVDPKAAHILSTVLDDDDGLASGFLAEAQTRAAAQIQSGKDWGWTGAENGWQWDLLRSDDGALGRIKPWIRRDFFGNPFFLSAGFSMWAPREANLSVFTFGHNTAHVWARLRDWPYAWIRSEWIWQLRSRFPMQAEKRQTLDRCLKVVKKMRVLCGMPKHSFRFDRRVALFFLESEVLMSNHGHNTELQRLHEGLDRADRLEADADHVHDIKLNVSYIRRATWL